MVKGLMLAGLLALGLVSGARAQQNTNITNLKSTAVSCASTATALVAARYRNAVTVPVPSSGVTVYIGSDSTVTTSTGFPIPAGNNLTLYPYNGALYCVVATGTQSVTPLESF